MPPSMNRHYLDADVPQWRSIFEGSGREVFDQRFRVVEALELEPGMRVADIGAGTGLYTMLFARAVGDQGKVYAVDISPTFVESIEERAAAYRVDNIIGIVNAEHSAELPPGAVDLVFLADTYHHFAYPQSMLRSMHQALVPGGTLAIIDFRRQPGFSSPWVMGHVRAGREQVINEVQRATISCVSANWETEPAMTPEFWQQRWQRGEIGWHSDAVNRHLTDYWPRLAVPKATCVLVPLCGKSLDMLWLAGEGYSVVGVELSATAAEAFFTENGLSPVVTDLAPYPFCCYHVDEIRLLVGDFFDLSAGALRAIGISRIDAVYDRAALVALPPELRARYAQCLAPLLRELPGGSAPVSLLVTFDYDQSRMPGPPFAVAAGEVQALFERDFRIDELTSLYRLQMLGAA